MRRTGCVLIPMLPLQILLRQKPHWAGAPVAVVDDEGPNGRLLFLNMRARQTRLRIGMRQAVARDLLPSLRTALVSEEETRLIVRELITSLQTFSPKVEADTRVLGAFNVDPMGLERLYGGYSNWAQCIHRYLRARHWHGSVAIGFHRYRSLAIAMQSSARSAGVTVLETPEEEQARSDETALSAFGLPGELCESLRTLGIETLGEFLRIPSGELHSRFGKAARELHELFSDLQLPIQPQAFDEPARVSFQIEPPDGDQHRLLFAIKGALHSLFQPIGARGEALQALHIKLQLERAPEQEERIEPAKPTTDAMALLELIRLRLAEVELRGEVEEVELIAETVRTPAEQSRLPGHEPRVDYNAASAALARIRAAYGEQSVTQARLQEAHLPEARFRWEPVQDVRPAACSAGNHLPMVRRILSKPRPLSPAPPANIERLYGPYRISGGWWKRLVERDYYYAETKQGDLLWLFYDQPRKRWFLHGRLD